MRGANPSHQRQPGCRFKFVVKEESLQVAGSGLVNAEVDISAVVVEQDGKVLVITLVKAVETCLQIISIHIGCEGYLSARIRRPVIVACCGGYVVGGTAVGGIVVMKGRGN